MGWIDSKLHVQSVEEAMAKSVQQLEGRWRRLIIHNIVKLANKARQEGVEEDKVD